MRKLFFLAIALIIFYDAAKKSMETNIAKLKEGKDVNPLTLKGDRTKELII